MIAVGVPRMKRRAGILVLKNSVSVIRSELSPVKRIKHGKKKRSENDVKRSVTVAPTRPYPPKQKSSLKSKRNWV